MIERNLQNLNEVIVGSASPATAKLKPICFDACQHVYRLMGEVVAKAFSVGKELM